MKYQATVQEQIIQIEKKEGKIFIDNQEIDFQELKSEPVGNIIKINGHVFRIQVLGFDEDSKIVSAKINGKPARISLKTETDLLLERMGGNGGRSASTKNIKAPMPGMIVKIQVAVGDVVEKGQALLNFEAMKMENQIKSPGAGSIKNILVAEGNKVDKGQLLIELA